MQEPARASRACITRVAGALLVGSVLAVMVLAGRAAAHGSPATPNTRIWAVIIGINDYPGTDHDLASAVADAELMNRTLAHLGVPAEHRTLLTDHTATPAAITHALAWLAEHTGPADTAVVFYAGHADTVTGQPALRAADGTPLTDTDLAADLAPVHSPLWITLASCDAGAFTALLAPRRLLTAAAPAGQAAYENTALGHSYLTAALLPHLDTHTSIQAAFAAAVAELRAQGHADRLPALYDQTTQPLTLAP